jgi:hypothetical protein
MWRKSSFAVALLAGAGLTALVGQPAEAGVTWFTDRAAWTAAAGSPTFSEDFSGFASDTEFRTTAVTLDGMSIQRIAPPVSSSRNFIDVSPFANSDNNSTPHASMYTNFNVTSVRITFALLNVAFGGESWSAASGEIAQMSIFSDSTLLDTQALGASAGAFLGYVLTGGDTATSVVFTSKMDDGAASSGEAFGYDNLVGRAAANVTVPLPGTAGLLALGLGAMWGARRRRT